MQYEADRAQNISQMNKDMDHAEQHPNHGQEYDYQNQEAQQC